MTNREALEELFSTRYDTGTKRLTAYEKLNKDLEILNILKKYIYINDYGFVCSKGGIMKENKIVKEWLENEK